MKPTDVATAITNSLVQGGSQWLISTIVAFLPVLWTMVLMFHLGRPYVLRTLRRLGLRLGADVWWMSYVLIRDGLLLLTFGLSWFYFEPNIVASLALPITGSLATLFLLFALAVKLSRRVDDDVWAYRVSTLFLVIGATLYYGPLVFAVEATTQTGGAGQLNLTGFGQAFTTNSNTTVALVLTWISLAGVAVVAAWLFARVLMSANRSMARRLKKETGETVPGAAAGGE
jgi:hypothetical protein